MKTILQFLPSSAKSSLPVRLQTLASLLFCLLVTPAGRAQDAVPLPSADSDYDGISDADEARDGTDPLDPASVRWVRLSAFDFTAPNLAGDRGQLPLQSSGLSWVDTTNRASRLMDGKAVRFTSTNSVLAYREVEADGRANINFRSGTLRFQLKTSWASRGDTVSGGECGCAAGIAGQGPRVRFYLLQAGDFAVWFDPKGTNLVMTSPGPEGTVLTNFSVCTTLCRADSMGNSKRDTWSITWSPSATSLHRINEMDGLDQLVARGPGIGALPSEAVRAKGFRIGAGSRSRKDEGDEISHVEIFNVPVESSRNPGNFMASEGDREGTIRLAWSGRTNGLYTVSAVGDDGRPFAASRVIGTSWNGRSPSTGRVNRLRVASTAYEAARNPGESVTQSVGFKSGPEENRGRVLLLVDETLANSLRDEVLQLKTNLIGDGWTVKRIDVPRHIDTLPASTEDAHVYFRANRTNALAIKQRIAEEYAVDPARTSRVLILGHVTIPFSGNQNDDGHLNHFGAWPADVFYGDMDGVWTDTRQIATNLAWVEATGPNNAMHAGAFDPRGYNFADDGKLDQDDVPPNAAGVSALELSVGRIDFARMPSFQTAARKGELDLLRQYLRKDAAFRTGAARYEQANTLGLYLGGLEGLTQSIETAAREATEALFGTTSQKLTTLDIYSNSVPYLMAFHGGFGGPNVQLGSRMIPQGEGKSRTMISEGWTTAHIASNTAQMQAAFTQLFGSYFVDWSFDDNILRATLGQPTGCLVAWWGTYWPSMTLLGLNQDIGAVLLEESRLHGPMSCRNHYLLGDLTLRPLILPAPLSGRAARTAEGMQLSWSGVAEAKEGYLVSRSASGIEGPFQKLTPSPINEARFTDLNAPNGPLLYSVKALKFTRTGRGSFTNSSQALFISGR